MENDIINEKKELFSEIISYLKRIFQNYQISDIIRFLNNEGIEFLKKYDHHSISEETFNICIKYNSGLINFLKGIMQIDLFLAIDNFDKLSPILLRNYDLAALFLREETFEKIGYFRLNQYFEIINFFQSKKLYAELIEHLLLKIVKYCDELVAKVTEDNVLQSEIHIKTIINFLHEIKDSRVNKYENKIEWLEEIKNKYFKKHGHIFSADIDISNTMQFLKDENIDWKSKILTLTHRKNPVSGNIEHYYNIVGEVPQSIIDFISTSISIDDYFTISKQQSLAFYDKIHLTIFEYYFREERIEDFFSMLIGLLEGICSFYNIDFKKNEFNIDIEILLQYCFIIFQASKDKNDALLKGMSYSITVFTCSMIEKLLRLLYKEQKKDLYLSIDWFSLGHLLDTSNEDNKTIIDLLSFHQVKFLEYYLLRNKTSKIGLNYRNNFAHYKNIKTDDFNYAIVKHIILLYLGIVNSLFVNTTKQL
ncbi:MAG: hypothetical protein LBR60_03960 [Fibrobacter sp.]|jgi:hypothetical protein|nr:hypothetical protein [Fibrobacter sp.]